MSVPNTNLEGASQSSDTPQLELGKATSSTSSQSRMPRPASTSSAPERRQDLRAKQLKDMTPLTAPSSTTASAPVMHTMDTMAPSMIENKRQMVNFILESLSEQIKELREFNGEMSNQNFENKNLTHRIDKFKKIYSNVHLFLEIKKDLEADINNSLLSYHEKIKEIGKIDGFEMEFRTFCKTNGKKLVHEIIEMEKFIELIDTVLQKNPELNYKDFSKDLYFQAKQNLANNNAQPDSMGHEIKNLIERAKVIKKMFFGNAEKDPVGSALRGIGKWKRLKQGYEVFYTEVSQRREESESTGCLVIWPSSKEPGQPDKYYISVGGTKKGPFTEQDLESEI